MELRPGLKDVRRPAELMHAYITLSLLAGIRTEEARALKWSHVDLDGDPAAPSPAHRRMEIGPRPRRHQDRTIPPHPRPPATAVHALRELRTTFVSLMSHQGVAIEEIARLAGHTSTRTTEIVYRRELRPVITTGAQIMDKLFTRT